MLLLEYDSVRKFLDEPDRGARLLKIASGAGHPNIVKRLLNMGADPFNMDEYEGSALACACRRRHEEVALILLEWYEAHGKFEFLKLQEKAFASAKSNRMTATIAMAKSIWESHSEQWPWPDPSDTDTVPVPIPNVIEAYNAMLLRYELPKYPLLFPHPRFDKEFHRYWWSYKFNRGYEKATSATEKDTFLKTAVGYIRENQPLFHGYCHMDKTWSSWSGVNGTPILLYWHLRPEIELAFLETDRPIKELYENPVARMRYAYEQGQIEIFEALRKKGVSFSDIKWDLPAWGSGHCYGKMGSHARNRWLAYVNYFLKSNEAMMSHVVDVMCEEDNFGALFLPQAFDVPFIDEVLIRRYHTTLEKIRGAYQQKLMDAVGDRETPLNRSFNSGTGDLHVITLINDYIL